MSIENDIKREINKIIKKYGRKAFLSAINENTFSKDSCLTIVSNKGMHPLPPTIRRGEVFFATEGNLDFSSKESITKEIENMLFRLHKKLIEKDWNNVYLVMHGHPILHVNIKMFVYRVLGMETIDWFYGKDVGYLPIKISSRNILLD